MKILLTILCLVLLSVHSYSQEVIPEVETVTRDGLIYHQLSTEPLTGTVVGFYENGRLESRRNYKDGKMDGLQEEFYENGQLHYRENYKDGKREGLYEEFYRRGQLLVRRNYINGKIPDGTIEMFDISGNLSSTSTWKHGVRVELNLDP
jgi:antitoxin component YwqK of YwqJK toxin-antitoxin module